MRWCSGEEDSAYGSVAAIMAGRTDRSEPHPYVVGSVPRDPLQEVAGLALQHLAHRLQGGEAHCLRAAVLEHRDVGRREAHALGELPHAHLAPGQLDIDPYDDGHRSPPQMTASISDRSSVAWSSSER